MSKTSTGHEAESRRYEIRFKGHLHSRWASSFCGLTVTNESDGTTLLEGLVADQAALHGVLRMVRDLGLPLLSVTRVEPDHQKKPQPKSGSARPKGDNR